MYDPNSARCGNPRIDAMAVAGHMRSLWDRLAYMFPMVKTHEESIWLARRSGSVRRIIETDQRFSVLLDSPINGPRNMAEWELLAIAALSAIGKEPCEGELALADGLWIGIPIDHPSLMKRHAGCSFCAEGWKPCPTTGYPMAHV